MNGIEVGIDRQPNDPDLTGVMTALVHSGPGHRAWETRPKPTIRERGDSIVRICRNSAIITGA